MEVVVHPLTFNYYVKNVTEVNQIAVPVKYTIGQLAPIAAKDMLPEHHHLNNVHHQQKAIQQIQLNAQELPKKEPGVRK